MRLGMGTVLDLSRACETTVVSVTESATIRLSGTRYGGSRQASRHKIVAPHGC